jgi:LysM repeat protein
VQEWSFAKKLFQMSEKCAFILFVRQVGLKLDLETKSPRRELHMHRPARTLHILALCCLGYSHAIPAQSLLGSPQSVERQYQAAVSYGYSFLDTPQSVNQFADSGYLVRIKQSPTLYLHNVSYPLARPQVRLFLERLSLQYHSACGEKLTVTSLTRPLNRQPANSVSHSVHPTGMAVDLRIPNQGKCRRWLENTLVSLERADVLDVTRERRPPHYHVALFTQPYEAYVASLGNGAGEYTVRKGDTLSTIARRTGSSVPQLKAANGLRGDLIRVGQELQIPGNMTSPVTAPIQMTASNSGNPDDNPELATSQGLTHQVRRGESLWNIARRYGTSVNHLREENGLADDLLKIGQELRISAFNTNL